MELRRASEQVTKVVLLLRRFPRSAHDFHKAVDAFEPVGPLDGERISPANSVGRLYADNHSD